MSDNLQKEYEDVKARWRECWDKMGKEPFNFQLMQKREYLYNEMLRIEKTIKDLHEAGRRMGFY